MSYESFVDAVEQELERLGYDELDTFALEQRRIFLWRATQLLGLGFSEDDSVALAQAAVDLGAARQLIARGCPPETAASILL